MDVWLTATENGLQTSIAINKKEILWTIKKNKKTPLNSDVRIKPISVNEKYLT